MRRCLASRSLECGGCWHCTSRQKGKNARFPLWSVLVHSRLLTACHRVTFQPTICKVHLEDAVASPSHLFDRVRHVFRHFVAVDRATTYCMFYVYVSYLIRVISDSSANHLNQLCFQTLPNTLSCAFQLPASHAVDQRHDNLQLKTFLA